MEIKRDFYLNKLINKIDNKLVKIISGLRRSGKSFLLFSLFKKYLLNNGICEDQIIEIQLELLSQSKLRDPFVMLDYIKSRISDNKKYFILIDEIQLCDKFIELLNELIHYNNLDVYVTGSNLKMLSKDIITEFRGRGDEIYLNPLSFAELYEHFKNYDEAIKYYFLYGGLPLTLMQDSEDQKKLYLVNLFKETYLKDILERNKIKYDKELETLLNILASSIGSLTSISKLVNTFKSSGVNISENTIKQYLYFLEDSFLIKKAIRYDIKGKKYINAPVKYYFTDLGLRNAKLNFRQYEEPHIMENIIYNELIKRGYSVDVGVISINEKENNTYVRKQIECDFVVNKTDKRYYIQSAYRLDSKEKREIEIRPFLNTKDSFKKIIIVKDDIPIYHDEYGITTISLKDFLLETYSLDY